MLFLFELQIDEKEFFLDVKYASNYCVSSKVLWIEFYVKKYKSSIKKSSMKNSNINKLGINFIAIFASFFLQYYDHFNNDYSEYPSKVQPLQYSIIPISKNFLLPYHLEIEYFYLIFIKNRSIWYGILLRYYSMIKHRRNALNYSWHFFGGFWDSIDNFSFFFLKISFSIKTTKAQVTI